MTNSVIARKKNMSGLSIVVWDKHGPSGIEDPWEY